MAMFMTSDPAADAERYLNELEDERMERMADRPTCTICGRRIVDDFAYNIQGDWYCEDCIDDCREIMD